MRYLWAGVVILTAVLPHAQAEVRLHHLFTDSAVLQRGLPLPIWGTAREGERVTVELLHQKATTTAENGRWMVRLPAVTKGGGPYTLTVKGDNTVVVKNVLVGEVWVCSGQSNMQWPVFRSADAEKIIAEAPDPWIRLFTVPRRATPLPETDVEAAWQESTPQTVRDFSAVAYAFGRALRKALNVPIGLISSNYGGTPAEAWTERSALEAHPQLQYLVTSYQKALDAYPQAVANYYAELLNYPETLAQAKREEREPPKAPVKPFPPAYSPWSPSGLYNAMIAPLIPYAIRGVIWYQGESNAGRAYEYRILFPTMIASWRANWGQGDFPFLFVQLAPFMKIEPQPSESAWAELREAQLLTLKASPNTAMAVVTDLGDENDIHPKQKAPVGERLALAARALAYGEKIVYSGPLYASMKVEDNRIILRFRHTGSGLVARGGRLQGFTICGEDHTFVHAEAEIQGNTVVVHSPQVPFPVAVRYGWANYPVVNLYNKEGLPASPFRTDDFPMVTAPRK
jgi:sialate O-acetylesterase